MSNFFLNYLSEILTFIGGFITGGLTVKICIAVKQRSSNNKQSGDNIANSGGVAAGTLNAPVNVCNDNSKNNSPSIHIVGFDCKDSRLTNCSSSANINFSPAKSVPKRPLSPQAKSLLKQFHNSTGNLLVTFAPGGITKRVQTDKNQGIITRDLLAVNRDLDNLALWGYLERQPDSSAGRKYSLTVKGRTFAKEL